MQIICVDLTTIQTSNWLCLSNGIVRHQFKWKLTISTWECGFISFEAHSKSESTLEFPGTYMVRARLPVRVCVCWLQHMGAKKGFQHVKRSLFDTHIPIIKTYWRKMWRKMTKKTHYLVIKISASNIYILMSAHKYLFLVARAKACAWNYCKKIKKKCMCMYGRTKKSAKS